MTETDKACERLIFDHLKDAFPTHEVQRDRSPANPEMWCVHIFSVSLDRVCDLCAFEQFIGEETAAELGSISLSDSPTWIIDPLDGTTNFVHRLVKAVTHLTRLKLGHMLQCLSSVGDWYCAGFLSCACALPW